MKTNSGYSARSIILVAVALAALISLPLHFKLAVPVSSLAVKELNEAGHTLLFFMLQLGSLWVAVSFAPSRFQRVKHRIVMTLTLALALFCVGVAIEAIQPYFHRTASFIDIVRNSLGILAASFFYWTWQNVWDGSGRPRWWSLAVSLLSLLAGFSMVLFWSYAQLVRNQQFPNLQSFDHPATRHFVQPYFGAQIEVLLPPADWKEASGKSALISFPKEFANAKVSLNAPVPHWAGYKQLEFDAYSLGDDFNKLGVNLVSSDKKHPMLRKQQFMLSPGPNRIRLSLEGEPPISHFLITEVVFFAPESASNWQLWIDNIRLSKISAQ